MQIRFWRQTDLPDLLRMAAVTTWGITPPDDQVHTSFETVAASGQRNLLSVLHSPYGTAVVADDGGRPVGYLLIGIQPDEQSGEMRGYMADIYVEPAYRRSGLSKEFHQIGEAYLRQIGIRAVTNWTHAHNGLGQGASTHHGYQLWGLMMVKHLTPTAGAVP